MGSKGDVKEFFGMRFAWRVLASCWCSGVSEPDLLVFGCFGTGPKAMRLHPCFYGFQWIPKVTGSGMGSKLAAVRVFRMGSSMALLGSLLVLAAAKGAGQETCFCFIWIPKVTDSILSDCILRGMGSNPAAVRVFRMGFSTAPLARSLLVLEAAKGAGQETCFCFMDA